MTFISRRCAGSSDIPLLVDWVRAIRSIERATDYPGVIDLPELLLLPRNQVTTRLWLAEAGELVGFAFVDAFSTLRFELDWGQTTPALETAIVAWGRECLSTSTDTTPSAVLYATSHEADTGRLACLHRQGFTRLADYIIHLERSLAAPINIAQLPAGFAIRQVEGEGEAADLATLHRAAFGTPYMTTERRLAMMRTTHYNPELDLVVVTPGGARAAYGMANASPVENELTGRNECYADLFATHPVYRGRGLARAALVTLLDRLKARGFATAKLNTSSENLPMQQVARSEGFQVVSATLRFALT